MSIGDQTWGWVRYHLTASYNGRTTTLSQESLCNMKYSHQECSFFSRSNVMFYWSAELLSQMHTWRPRWSLLASAARASEIENLSAARTPRTEYRTRYISDTWEVTRDSNLGRCTVLWNRPQRYIISARFVYFRSVELHVPTVFIMD